MDGDYMKQIYPVIITTLFGKSVIILPSQMTQLLIRVLSLIHYTR